VVLAQALNLAEPTLVPMLTYRAVLQPVGVCLSSQAVPEVGICRQAACQLHHHPLALLPQYQWQQQGCWTQQQYRHQTHQLPWSSLV
jgi:hypothetical protein